VADQEKLEQELRDERARRRDAERRLEDLSQRADLWRQRAEERSERIERLLEARRRKTNTLRRWVRGLTRPEEAETVAEAPTEPPKIEPKLERRPGWPSSKATVVVTVAANRGIGQAVATFDDTPLTHARDSDLDRADFLVLEPSAVRALDAASRDRLYEWAARPGRQPLIVWASDDDLSIVNEIRGPQDAVVAADAALAEKLGVDHLPGSFDPGKHRPGTRPEQDTALLDLTAPALEVIEGAASGRGLTAQPGSGVASRRWAYRRHSPWVRGEQLMDLAGVAGRDPKPSITAVLVSHRPGDLERVVASLLEQTHRPLELVVAVHGAEPTPAIERMLAGADVPAEVFSFDRELTLGECLNRAAEHTTSPLLAKIDDDDHYGPAHLEDSFHALSYSGADIVGKGAHYTYLAEVDETFLRHPGTEESFIDGSPNGATLVFRREVWDRVGFPHRPRHVDTGFLRAARSIGADVYAGSRWEFCYVRRSDGHTWNAEAALFSAGSEKAWDGFHPERAEVSDVEPS